MRGLDPKVVFHCLLIRKGCVM